MPDNTKIGAFTVGVARPVKFGTATMDSHGSAASVSDEYVVLMPDTETRATTANTSGLPDIGDTHGTYTALTCSEIQFTSRGEGSLVWDISVSYERKSAESKTTPTSDEGNITALEWGTVSHQTDLVCDAVNGRAVLNTAGDPYQDAIQTESCDIQIHFARKERKANLDKLKLSGTINKAEVKILGWTFPKHTARVQVHLKDTLDTEARAMRYEYDYTITARTCNVKLDGYEGGDPTNVGWDVPMLEAGFQYLDGDGQKVKFLVGDGKGGLAEPAMPQLLSSTGGPASEGSKGVITTYAQFPEADWGVLKLPAEIPTRTNDPTPNQTEGGS